MLNLFRSDGLLSRGARAPSPAVFRGFLKTKPFRACGCVGANPRGCGLLRPGAGAVPIPGKTVPTRLKSVFLGLLVTLFLVPQVPAASDPVRWGGSALRQDADWYASDEGRESADTLLRYQSSHGAWPKNTDLFKSLPSDELARIPDGKAGNTIDNGATTTPMRFLAKMIHATDEARYRESFIRGLDYLLEAQYPDGGWPQFYPLRKGYYSHITFNDSAMIRVMELLRDIAEAEGNVAFVDEDRRARAAEAVARGVGCILKLQVVQDGRPTVWCAQYDEDTLEPAWARAYEPPSLSGSESVGIVRFLMSVEEPTPEIDAAIKGAAGWFQSVAMEGVRLEEFRREDGRRDRRLVPDPSASPLWARFYELGTNRPLFLDRDSVFHHDYADIGYERRNGYSYLGRWPANLLTRDYPRWVSKTNP